MATDMQPMDCNMRAGEGAVVGPADSQGWVKVKWDHGEENSYQWGSEGKYDLEVVGGATEAKTGQVRRLSGARACKFRHAKGSTHIPLYVCMHLYVCIPYTCLF